MKLRQKPTALAIIVILFTVAGCFSSSGSPDSFHLKFPDNVDLGELWLIEDVNCYTCGTSAKKIGRALGGHDVKLPAAHWFVSLRMPKGASRLMPYLKDLSLARIGDLQLQGSDVRDEDLQYVAGMNLRSINLYGTKITGAGLEYLKPNEMWLSVDLTNIDSLDPEYLSHFKGWKRSTIRLTSRKWGGDNYTDAEARLLDRANEIICDGQPEGVCGTQIR